MIQTRQILEQYKYRYPDFEYYYTIIEKIENNEKCRPDICIETCQSIVEGVSKSVILKLDKTQNRKIVEGKKIMPSYESAIRILAQEYKRIDNVDSIFDMRIAVDYKVFIEEIRTLRNDRSDISHGRPVPKEVNSSIKLARTIKGITDHIVAYILEHLFILLDALPKALLAYNSEECEEFNKLLDLEYENFPISKARYSQVLYDYEPETYFIKYTDFTSTTDDDTTIATEEYNLFSFWTDSRIDVLNEFCQGWKFNPSKVLDLIDKYWGRMDSVSLDELIDLMYIQADREENERIAQSVKSDLQLLIKQVLEIKK